MESSEQSESMYQWYEDIYSPSGLIIYVFLNIFDCVICLSGPVLCWVIAGGLTMAASVLHQLLRKLH